MCLYGLGRLTTAPSCRCNRKRRALLCNRGKLPPGQRSESVSYLLGVLCLGNLVHAGCQWCCWQDLSAVACVSGIEVERVLVTNMDADAQVCPGCYLVVLKLQCITGMFEWWLPERRVMETDYVCL